MKTLVLTGFEPFGTHSMNPSEGMVKRLDGEVVNDLKIRSFILPVTYSIWEDALKDIIKNENFDAFVATGLAGDRTSFSLERVAINHIDSPHEDNNGHFVHDSPVIVGGPDGLFTTLPLRKMQRAAQREGIPCDISLSAGSYVCNQVMYHILYEVRISGASLSPPVLSMSLKNFPKRWAPMLAPMLRSSEHYSRPSKILVCSDPKIRHSSPFIILIDKAPTY